MKMPNNLDRTERRVVVKSYFDDLRFALDETFSTQHDNILLAGDLLRETLLADSQVFVLGNGGSSSQSNHTEAEFFFWKHESTNKSIRGGIRSLSSNSDALTALANDHGDAYTFSFQLSTLAKKGDSVLAISTSGNSRNVYEALNRGHEMGIKSIGLYGKSGGNAINLTDIPILVQGSTDTNVIQDVHSSLCHILLRLALGN